MYPVITIKHIFLLSANSHLQHFVSLVVYDKLPIQAPPHAVYSRKRTTIVYYRAERYSQLC